MFDETSRSHADDDSTRHIHRGHRPPEEKRLWRWTARPFCAGNCRPHPAACTAQAAEAYRRACPGAKAAPAAGRMRIPARPTRNEVLFC